MKRWSVVDTNVLVSGVFRAGVLSPPGRIVKAMLAGDLRFLVSEELVTEYRRVLLLPWIAERHGMDAEEVDALLGALLENSAIRKPPKSQTPAPAEADGAAPPVVPGDEHIVALLSMELLAILISGDRVLAEALRGWREVLSPADFASGLG
jgi:predicted nucleic acid-binding protein